MRSASLPDCTELEFITFLSKFPPKILKLSCELMLTWIPLCCLSAVCFLKMNTVHIDDWPYYFHVCVDLSFISGFTTVVLLLPQE
jgi:hypothetical protein